MFALLPIIAFVCIFLLFYSKLGGWREGLLFTSIVWGCLLSLMTELLDRLSVIHFTNILTSWILIIFILSGMALIKFSRDPIWNKIIGNRTMIFKNSIREDLVFLTAVGVLCLLVFIVAIIAPPNHWDSMTYHMPRVFHWIQNQSIKHYPTHWTPQIYQPPFSGFVILHLQILSGGDRFANLVQYFSMTGCLIGVSLISKELGCQGRGQIFSIVVCATIPVGILCASNTNNNYVVSYWMVCVAYFVIRAIKTDFRVHSLIKVGLSLSLAIFTKGTAYLYAFPFCLWLFYAIATKGQLFKLLQAALILSGSTLIINLGHYTRNFRLFGSILSTGSQKWTPDLINPASLISGLIKNLSIHMSIPIFDSPFNKFIERMIYLVHDLIGIDINDVRLSDTQFSFQNSISLFEDMAGNQLHFWLITILILVFFIRSKAFFKTNPGQRVLLFSYLITALGSFIIFSALLKWQIYHSRLHLAIFVLLSPFVGAILERIVLYRSKCKLIVQVCLLLLLSFSWPYALANSTRPLIGNPNIFTQPRDKQYFTLRGSFQSYKSAAKLIKADNCRKVGLIERADVFEYPLLKLVADQDSRVKIHHILVNNQSKALYAIPKWGEFSPCLIMSLENPLEREIIFQQSHYREAEKLEGIQIFLPVRP